MGLIIVAIRQTNAAPPPDPALLSVGFAAVYLAPAALAFIGHRRNDGPTLAAAAVLCGLASVTSFTGVTLPFLIPAVLLAAAAAGRPWRSKSVLGAALAAASVAAAWFAVVMMREWQCVNGPGYEACGDDPTTTGGLIALALVGLALAATLTALRSVDAGPART
jgi:4-amino-4-deoxy-L-arabinose transferase-like glycosyltransferase